jgi:hypothetical protein
MVTLRPNLTGFGVTVSESVPGCPRGVSTGFSDGFFGGLSGGFWAVAAGTEAQAARTVAARRILFMSA